MMSEVTGSYEMSQRFLFLNATTFHSTSIIRVGFIASSFYFLNNCEQASQRSSLLISEFMLPSPKPCSHCVFSLLVVSDSATPWTVDCQAPLSMEFSRQEYWSELSFPSPGDFPNPGIEPGFPALQTDALPSEPPEKPITSEPQAKPKSIGVGSLSLLQGIFPTQESNWGLLHCRQILYQLAYQANLVSF